MKHTSEFARRRAQSARDRGAARGIAIDPNAMTAVLAVSARTGAPAEEILNRFVWAGVTFARLMEVMGPIAAAMQDAAQDAPMPTTEPGPESPREPEEDSGLSAEQRLARLRDMAHEKSPAAVAGTDSEGEDLAPGSDPAEEPRFTARPDPGGED